MKTAPDKKNDDNLIFTHRGRACTVRRGNHRHAKVHHELHQVSSKSRPTILERLFLSLLPRLGLGEIV